MGVLTRPNVHISYIQDVRPYHGVFAGLVEKYGKQGDKILDVGCGIGTLLRMLSDNSKDFTLHAADIDANCLKITGESARVDSSMKIDDVTDLFEMNMNESYDLIIMSHVLEHVKRPTDTVQGLMKMLKPGGYLILAVPNPVRPDVIVFNLFRMFDKLNFGHVQTWDRAHWRNFLERINGLKVLEYPVDFIKVPKIDQIRFFHPILRFFAKVFPGFSRSCMAVIQK